LLATILKQHVFVRVHVFSNPSDVYVCRLDVSLYPSHICARSLELSVRE